MIGPGEADYSLLSPACQKGPLKQRRKCLIGIARFERLGAVRKIHGFGTKACQDYWCKCLITTVAEGR